MDVRSLRRINFFSFLTALTTIVLGVVLGILGVWGVVPQENSLLWKRLATDGIVFAGAVLTNLAIACYRNSRRRIRLTIRAAFGAHVTQFERARGLGARYHLAMTVE